MLQDYPSKELKTLIDQGKQDLKKGIIIVYTVIENRVGIAIGVTEELSKNVIKALENRSACLMSNHGQVAFGKNLEDAFELAQEIENICHQYTIALKLGQPKILSFKEMKKVLDKAKNYKKG